MLRFGDVPANINFPQEEERTLKRWQADGTFKKSLELAKGRKHFTFYDGPPLPTSMPPYGQILTGTIKDAITRWAQQNGYYVERRFNWVTHGLRVDFEIDKKLGIQSPQDVIEMGIANYNKECRSLVMHYSRQWHKTAERMGRWIDFENDYERLYPLSMESVWWVFSELHTKELVYRAVKVLPYCTDCATPLSNFEADQNYKMVVDPGAYVAFELVERPNRFLVIYTTTPWTLPSNLAIAVHPDLKYAVVKCTKSGKELIMLEERVPIVFTKKGEYELLETMQGAQLEGLQYKPLFPYFEHLKTGRAFHVLTGTFITTDRGTGVVHQAPYFGEIDYTTCIQHGVIKKDATAEEMVCPVDENGCFTAQITDYAGAYVKEADKLILKRLRDSGALIKQEDEAHSYPFCWRSNTPLFYKAVPSWFIRVESMVEDLLKNNEKTKWVPAFVQEKRFANWLRDARDWAVSRNRFWGTPINLWVSDDFSEVVCPASIEELEQLSGTQVTDLHRESVDQLEIRSPTSGRVLKRVSEVFDCWFESGAMPFENRDHFESNFPADFIAEGIDQTRGWFYTLLVLSTALFNKPPFKNVICNGLVLAADGEKMSKSEKNYPDPMEIVNKYGADALRLYLINSPVVRGENLCFREDGVNKVLKEVLLPWFNAFRILLSNINLYEVEIKKNFVFSTAKPTNVMDKWIISFTNRVVAYVRKEMGDYHLYTVVAPLTRYFETLTNVYCRPQLTFARELRKMIHSMIRLYSFFLSSSDDDEADRQAALSALAHVMLLIVKLMSPFTPFFCDYLWQTLRKIVGAPEESVHFALIPESKSELIDETAERRVAAMRQVVDIARAIREKEISVRYPLKEIVVMNRDPQFLQDVESLQQYLLSELNVKKLINQVSEEELESFVANGKLTVLGHELTDEEVAVSFTCQPGKNSTETWESLAEGQTVVLLNTAQDEALIHEGLSSARIRLPRMGVAALDCDVDRPPLIGKLEKLEDAGGEKEEKRASGARRFDADLSAVTEKDEEGEAEMEITQLVHLAGSELLPNVLASVLPSLSYAHLDQDAVEHAKKELLAQLQQFDKLLLTRTFLVGERLSAADVSVALSLVPAFKSVLDSKARKNLENLTHWFTTVIDQPQVKEVIGEVKEVIGEVKLAKEATTSHLEQFKKHAAGGKKDDEKHEKKHDSKKEHAEKEKKEKPAPKEKAAPKEKEPKEEEDDGLPQEPKFVDPFNQFPAGEFNMDAFKRVYLNEDTVTKAISYFWEKFEPENYSIWYGAYKYSSILEKIPVPFDLIAGMFQRLEKMRKHAFGSVCLFGENNDSTISGIWVWRGPKLAFELCPDWQVDYESYEWKKLDPNSEETKKTVNAYLAWEGFDNPKPFNQGKIFK
ncbi:Isoleucyl-tRNA synthetase [Aphelenchoides fujianensis]|nr:Isoleucyl-tRNA synthetase [Aphelenchoides fujianensis]